MQSDVSFERRLRYQDMAIARLMCETRLLRDENAALLARLEMARKSGPDSNELDVSRRSCRPARVRRPRPGPP